MYPCSAFNESRRVVTKFTINAFTARKSFDPVELYFAKLCGSGSSRGNA